GKAVPLQVGQWMLLRDHHMLGRNKIQPKYAEEVWVEVLDEVSGVYQVKPQDELGLAKVLYHSNLHPWGGRKRPGRKDQQDREEKQDGAQEVVEDKDQMEMPDVAEVLNTLGVSWEKGESREDLDSERDMALEPPMAFRDENKAQEWNVGAPEVVPERFEELSEPEDGRVELFQPRHSQRIANRTASGFSKNLVRLVGCGGEFGGKRYEGI
ncbi:hypothetical protein Hamer_G015088, partial [Homarus americanus]